MSGYQRYLACTISLLIALFGSAWAFTSLARPYFLPGNYGTWRARLEMVAKCDVGQMAILGDSRAGSAYDPKLLGPDVRNFGMSGIGPVEGYLLFRKILQCPNPPKKLVLAFSPRQFKNFDFFWNESVAYGGLTADDLADIARTERLVGQPELYHYAFGAEPPPVLKNWLYLHYFPPYHFAQLLVAPFERRAALSARNYDQVVQNQGQFIWPSYAGCKTFVTEEGYERGFEMSRLSDYYYNKLIAAALGRGIKVIVGPVPINSVTARSLKPIFVEGYHDYLAKVAQHHPGLRIAPDLLPVMNDCSFSDGNHVSRSGAAEFTKIWGRATAASL